MSENSEIPIPPPARPPDRPRGSYENPVGKLSPEDQKLIVPRMADVPRDNTPIDVDAKVREAQQRMEELKKKMPPRDISAIPTKKTG